MVTTAEVGIDVRANNRRLARDLRNSRRTISRSLFFIRRDLTAAIAPIAALGTAAFAGLVSGAVQASNAIAEIGRNARAANIDVERFQVLSLATQRAGFDVDNYTDAIRRSSEIVFEANRGNQEFVDLLALMGLEVEDLIRLGPEQTFTAIAQGIQSVQDEASRQAIGEILFSDLSRATDLFSLTEGELQRLETRLRSLNLVVSRDTVAAIEQFRLEAQLIPLVVSRQFAAGFIESAGIAGILEDSQALDDAIRQIGEAARDVGEVTGNFFSAINSNRDAFLDVAQAAGFVVLAWAAIPFVSLGLNLAELSRGIFGGARRSLAYIGGTIGLSAATQGLRATLAGVGIVSAFLAVGFAAIWSAQQIELATGADPIAAARLELATRRRLALIQEERSLSVRIRNLTEDQILGAEVLTNRYAEVQRELELVNIELEVLREGVDLAGPARGLDLSVVTDPIRFAFVDLPTQGFQVIRDGIEGLRTIGNAISSEVVSRNEQALRDLEEIGRRNRPDLFETPQTPLETLSPALQEYVSTITLINQGLREFPEAFQQTLDALQPVNDATKHTCLLYTSPSPRDS